MMDEDFLNRKEIRIYKRVLIGAIGFALAFFFGVAALMFL